MMGVTVAILLLGLITAAVGTVVEEVSLGGTAVLPCPSSEDPLHRFMFWELRDAVIGPGNAYDASKYHYEVWSGRLFIRGVSAEEAGVYKCISKHVANAGLRIEPVELVVQRDWEDSFEEDPAANAYRAVIAILVLLIVVMVGVFAYCIKAKRGRDLQDMGRIVRDTREDSPQEGPSSGRAYNPTTTDKPYSSKPVNRSLDTAIVDTDIKTSFSLTDYP